MPTATLPRPSSVRRPRRAAADALLERRTLRRLLDEATGLVASVVPGHRDRAALVVRHLDELVGMLSAHEAAITRAGLRVARRDPVAAEAVARLRGLRGDLGVQLARLRLATPYWGRGASAVCRDTVWEVLLELGSVVDALFATEETGVLPFVTDDDLPPRRPGTRELGHLLETLTPAAGARWRRERMSPSERAWWALLAGPAFARERRRLLV